MMRIDRLDWRAGEEHLRIIRIMNKARTRNCGSFPADWRMVALGEVCDVVSGQVNPTLPEYRNLPHVNGQNIESGTGRLLDVSTAAEDGMTSGKYLFAPGDVLYSKLRPYLRKVVLVDFQGVCSADMYPLRPHPDVLDPEFFKWLLLSDDFTTYADGESRRARMPKLNREQLFSWLAPLPPLAEQQRIAGILKEQLAAVERARAAAQDQLDAANALPAAYLREVFEGEHARTWESRRLGDLITRFNHIIHPGDPTKGEAIFVGLEHIEPNTGRRIGSLTLDLGSLTGRKPTFKKGQIVYGYLRPYLNKVWIAEFDGCSSVDQFAFEVNCDVADVAFVAAFLRSETFLRRSAVVTTTGQLPRISIDEILAVQIDVPSTVAEQSRIASNLSARLNHAIAVAQSCQSQTADISSLAPALLRAAFQGQL